VKKRSEGRDEPILEPDLPIIDAHHHLFVRPGVHYLVEDYLADVTAGHRVVASVYSETMAFARPDGPEVLRPAGEVEFANGVAAMSASGAFGNVRLCAAIIGHADMRHGDDVARLFDRCLEIAPTRYRGIRQVALHHVSEAPYAFMPHRPPQGLLHHPEFRSAFRHLASRRLIFDTALFSEQLPELAAIADAFPETTITVNHLGIAMGLGLNADERGALFKAWRRALEELAQRPNIYCKVGGLGLPFWGFGFESRDDAIGYEELAAAWRPYVETALEVFGASRCMAESDFPPDGRSCGFVPLWNALKHIVRNAGDAEKADLFHRTARRVHRMDLPEGLVG
jgi:predicted TIM-barrel fold metal-dependent hydrolase